MFSQINRRHREQSTAQHAVSQAVACITEPLERRLFLSTTYTFSTPVTFTGPNGQYAGSGLVADAQGNLYGTTATGGSSFIAGDRNRPGYGMVFEIAAGTHTQTTLVNFEGTDGAAPYGTLVIDSQGNLYGTCSDGGADNCGTVFKIAAGTHVLSTLATFSGANGIQPIGGLMMDSGGNLFGTTFGGGAHLDGTAFEVVAGSGVATALVSFNGSNGQNPDCNLIADSDGNLYGTTEFGGASGDGTVFKIAAGTHALSTLVTFNSTNGARPYGGLIADSSGNFYGTTQTGGANDDGTVYKVAASNNALSTLVTFNGRDGGVPRCSLIADADGNLYGTTYGRKHAGDGTVFEIAAGITSATPAGVGTNPLITLAAFNGTDGEHPLCGIFADGNGNLWGTTNSGGGTDNGGTVFELSPSRSISGNVFNDRGDTGIKTRRDNGLDGITVTLQKLRHGKPLGRAVVTTTDAEGDYSFSDLLAGTYKVSETLPRGDILTTPASGSYTVVLTASQDSTGNNFGDHKRGTSTV